MIRLIPYSFLPLLLHAVLLHPQSTLFYMKKKTRIESSYNNSLTLTNWWATFDKKTSYLQSQQNQLYILLWPKWILCHVFYFKMISVVIILTEYNYQHNHTSLLLLQESILQGRLMLAMWQTGLQWSPGPGPWLRWTGSGYRTGRARTR